MRKLLLATTAMLGGLGLVGTASAQVKLNDGTTITTPFTAGGGLGALQPQPGNIVVHLDGSVRTNFTAAFDQGANGNIPAPTVTINTAGAAGGNLKSSVSGPEKLDTFDIGTSLRINPGFDGVAANGMQYGAYAEIRFDQKGTSGQNPYNLSGNTFGTLNGGATATPDVEQRTRDAAYLYPAWGYVGTPQLGIVRMGSLFTSSAMLLTGTMENFDDGGWHGQAGLQVANAMMWPFVDNGVIGTGVGSVQYLSPQIFGFDGSVTYQPNTGGTNPWSGCITGAAGYGCDTLSSSADPSTWARRTNTVDMALRYRGAFGPVGIATSGGFIFSGHVLPTVSSVTTSTFNPNSITAANPSGVTTTTAPVGNFNSYKNLNVGLFGVQVSYGGLLVGGHVEWGAFGYQQALEATGASRQVSWVGGATYTVGAATFGFQWFDMQNSLAQVSATVGPRRMTGPFLGAQYILAPGLLTFVGYGYTNDWQSGYNWVTGAPNTAASGFTTNNSQHNQFVTLGTVFSW